MKKLFVFFVGALLIFSITKSFAQETRSTDGSLGTNYGTFVSGYGNGVWLNMPVQSGDAGKINIKNGSHML